MSGHLESTEKTADCTCAGDRHIVRPKICPKSGCGRPLPTHGLGGISFSRIDEQPICSKCGTEEAMSGIQRRYPNQTER